MPRTRPIRRRCRDALRPPVARGAAASRSQRGRRRVTLGNRSAATINHLGQLPAVTISFNLAPGMALCAGGRARRAATARELQLPATITASFQGTAQAFQYSLRGMGVLLLLAIFVIYLVLGILYESFIHPLTILSGLPTAVFGALLTLLVFGTDLDSTRSSASSC